MFVMRVYVAPVAQCYGSASDALRAAAALRCRQPQSARRSIDGSQLRASNAPRRRAQQVDLNPRLQERHHAHEMRRSDADR